MNTDGTYNIVEGKRSIVRDVNPSDLEIVSELGRDVLDSIVQALKSIVMAHPASSAALNDQVDTIIICSLESSHYSTDNQNGIACPFL